jgi:hypothetical protein
MLWSRPIRTGSSESRAGTAYIAGVGVEILANSDNVLRAGLTAKHIDIPELLRIVEPAADVPVLPPRPLPGLPGAVVYESPAPEFRLYRFTLTGEQTELPASGPRIALCTDGGALLRDAGGAELKTPAERIVLPVRRRRHGDRDRRRGRLRRGCRLSYAAGVRAVEGTYVPLTTSQRSITPDCRASLRTPAADPGASRPQTSPPGDRLAIRHRQARTDHPDLRAVRSKRLDYHRHAYRRFGRGAVVTFGFLLSYRSAPAT